jgi:chemotaxis protein CheD
MSNNITVDTAALDVARSPDILSTRGIGSCVSVCLYDKTSKIGGLAHIMAPYNKGNDKSSIGKYADTGIAELIRLMMRMGASKDGLVARIGGGARVVFGAQQSMFSIGKNNIAAVRRVLADNRIPISAEDTGGTHGRGLVFHTETGVVEVTILSRPSKRLLLK